VDRQLVLAVDRRRTGAPPVDEMDMLILVQIIKLIVDELHFIRASSTHKPTFTPVSPSPSWTL